MSITWPGYFDFKLHCLVCACVGIIADKNCDEVILEPRVIAVRYIKTWFLVDLISSLPLDYIILLFSPERNVVQFVRAGNHQSLQHLIFLLTIINLINNKINK